MDEQQPGSACLPLSDGDGEGWLGELPQSRNEPDTIERGSAKRGKALSVIIDADDQRPAFVVRQTGPGLRQETSSRFAARVPRRRLTGRTPE